MFFFFFLIGGQNCGHEMRKWTEDRFERNFERQFFKMKKNVLKMAVPFLNMSWHAEWYLIKKEIGHVSIHNLKLYATYIGGSSGVNTWICTMRQFLIWGSLRKDKNNFQKYFFLSKVTEVLFQITTQDEIDLCKF